MVNKGDKIKQNENESSVAKDINVPTKIEELDIFNTNWDELFAEQKIRKLLDKLNEVIRKVNGD